MFLTVIDHIGVFVFAVSGILTAASKKLDVFGCVVIAFITALGGGTLRDLLLNTDVAWMKSETLIVTVLAAVPTGLILKRRILAWKKVMFLFDTLGIGVCTILGTQKALGFQHLWLVAIFLGVISATFGGVIRDVLCNEIPLIFRKEIYATACLAGALLFVLSTQYHLLDGSTALVVSSLLIAVIRWLAVRYEWQIPIVKMDE